MDAADNDVFIQKHAADFIADFDRSLGPFLRKPNGQLRRRVRSRETLRLISQELPQLLDPHLPRWLPVLANAYLECLQDRRKSSKLSTRSQLLYPLQNAICRIIYTFCKVRGEKVIVRFLNVETRYLELLLQAIEDSERGADAALKTELVNAWTWHERYVVLIWLSQLFFAPFDLSTISSGGADEFEQPDLPGFQWPQHVPRITLRVVPLAICYLASPGKERDGAKALLVRLAMRKDMQELGVLNALVQWALYTLRSTKDTAEVTSYYFIGSLSFLAGVLRAAEDTSIMDNHLATVFDAIQAIPAEDNDIHKVINGSAVARKVMIKITRSIITIVLRKSQQSIGDTEMVETTIGYLLERLADNDTPVRFAASKALSIITLKLDPDMASQVIEAVIDSLNRNVLWVENKSDPKAPAVRDLAAVDPLEWHGLMLTLSHLLYRRSPPLENLSHIIHTLLIGLSFEKRTPSGSSMGTNVRDASCFGIWALARRYSTVELLQVETQSVLVARGHNPTASILQVIATELVVTASLDPAGNIRRGSSAALQELIGRHPDTVETGISVVQTVDYHAVALRSRAIHEVALRATRLSPHYGHALLEATLGWRGIGDMDASARRVAATSFGVLTAELARAASEIPLDNIATAIEMLLARIQRLQVRQVEERHGLLLSLAAIFDSVPNFIEERGLEGQVNRLPIPKVYSSLKAILQESKDMKFRKPELIAEAIGTLIVSATPVLLLRLSSDAQQLSQLKEFIERGSVLVDETKQNLLLKAFSFIDVIRTHKQDLFEDFLEIAEACVNDWLDRNEAEVIQPSSEAALILLLLSSPARRGEIIKNWCEKISTPHTPRGNHGDGYFHALTRSQPFLNYLETTGDAETKHISIPTVLGERWAKDHMVETHSAILQSLIDKNVLRTASPEVLGLISEGLDNYTTTARGDIGSHVRLEAIRATRTLWQTRNVNQESAIRLFPQILRLAAEKLDRVRAEAKSALEVIIQPSDCKIFKELSFASRDYFNFLFTLRDMTRLDLAAHNSTLSIEGCTSSLLAGLVTSADTGNDDLVVETRAALAQLCEVSDEDLRQVYGSLLYNLKLYAGQDRVLVPTLEVIAYLSHVGLLQRWYNVAYFASANNVITARTDGRHINLKQLCLLVQKAAYKTGNVRKLEACIKVYGAIASLQTERTHGDIDDAGRLETAKVTDPGLAGGEQHEEGVAEAKKRLAALLAHPWPRVRSMVVDEVWSLVGLGIEFSGGGDRSDGKQEINNERRGYEEMEKAAAEEGMKKSNLLLGTDWGKADKVYIKRIVGEIGLE
ncbi:tubulin folding cofactor D C terminal-domain-containing protein [Xylaria bambusicola]|uniref:tubulin folding cofactor D C terminal-domain-containing protein n=1 Tax=Xylaria bambusicola TaxID=326684 RepID=UPI002007816B|nr:tubulin folding cofactor D C terminal-domain-containing protein [Xylaria bambusicola]KAI0525731.1 tubulin folding cofactor D C terminal-domain-containing protein [Xylaria bambusicola]